MKTRITVVHLVMVLLLFSFAAEAQDANEDIISITPKAFSCQFSYKTLKPEPGIELIEETLALMKEMGIAVIGIKEGFGAQVMCGSITGSGWIDSAGALQSFIVPIEGWFIEMDGTDWKSVDGKFHIITRKLLIEGEDIVGTYSIFVGEPLSDYSTRLLMGIGMGIKSKSSSILVRLNNGRKLKGQLASNGDITVSANLWEQ